MVWEQTVLIDGTEDVALEEKIAFLDFSWLEAPELGGVEGRDINTSGNEDWFWVVGNDLEGSLNTVEDLIEDTGTKFDCEGLFSSFDGVSDSKSSWIKKQLQVS